MKNILKVVLCTLVFMGISYINPQFYSVEADTATAPVTGVNTSAAISISPLDVVNNPEKYLNKTITFSADFAAFTSLGLDYKPAYKDPLKYIGILIKRPDVTDHVIPLSEMKIFLKRDVAEKYADIKSGDKVKITGKVFSTALGDPWVDITSFEVLSGKTKSAK